MADRITKKYLNDDILDPYDTIVASSLAHSKDATYIPLPRAMRLVDLYFENRNPVGEEEFNGQLEWRIFNHGTRDARIDGTSHGQGIRVHTSGTSFNRDVHSFNKHHRIEEEVRKWWKSGEYSLDLTITAAGESYDHILLRVPINKISGTIKVTGRPENYFETHNVLDGLDYDQDRYHIHVQKQEVVVTPKYDVTERNFKASLRELIGVTHTILTKMHTMGINVEFMKEKLKV